jgi:hypothetical protein
MGWADSPPFFCAYTKTIMDMVNQEQYHIAQIQNPHKLLTRSQTPGQPDLLPLEYADVYIDDFMLLT